jgi:hypothetical protein
MPPEQLKNYIVDPANTRSLHTIVALYRAAAKNEPVDLNFQPVATETKEHGELVSKLVHARKYNLEVLGDFQKAGKMTEALLLATTIEYFQDMLSPEKTAALVCLAFEG